MRAKLEEGSRNKPWRAWCAVFRNVDFVLELELLTLITIPHGEREPDGGTWPIDPQWVQDAVVHLLG